MGESNKIKTDKTEQNSFSDSDNGLGTLTHVDKMKAQNDNSQIEMMEGEKTDLINSMHGPKKRNKKEFDENKADFGISKDSKSDYNTLAVMNGDTSKLILKNNLQDDQSAGKVTGIP